MGMYAEARLAWGVALGGSYYHDACGEFDKDAYDNLEYGDGECPTGVGTANYGYEYDGCAVVVSRTYCEAGCSGKTIDGAKLAPPTEEEKVALNKALDLIGFTGDRTPTLILAASYG